MASTLRLLYYHRPNSIRLPLSVLFVLVIVLSIVLTLISLNESLETGRLWPTMSRDAAHPPRDVRPDVVAGPAAVEVSAALNFTADTYLTEPVWDGVSVNLKSQRKPLPRVLQFKRFKSKLLLLRSPFIPNSSAGRDHGWKVLPGNIVVHDGDYDNPHNFAYITNAADTCKHFFDESRTRILIFVESNARNSDRRQLIRSTWALPMLQKALNFKVVFLLGKSRNRIAQDVVDEEFYAYGDIVQENFTESFKHLTLKSVMGLKWTRSHCPEADFIMKTDDDILIHVPNLIQMLAKHRGTEQLLLCHKNRSRQIIRRGSPLIKYQVSLHELPGSYFPAYCGGFAYVMSRSVLHSLYEASTRTPYFFIEDVYTTGFCRHKAGIELVDHSSISLRPHVTAAQSPCSFAEGRITSQELSAEEMKRIWEALNTRGFFCPVPIATNLIDSH